MRDHATRWLGLLVALVVFHSCLQALVIASSLGEIELSQPIALVLLAVAALAGGFAGWSALRAVLRAGPAVAERPTTSRVVGNIAGGILLLAALLWGILWLASLVGRDRSFDGNAYHIPTIHFWAMKGFVHWVDDGYDGASLMNGYPKAAELLAFVLVRAFATNHVLTITNLLLLPMGSIAIACLAAALGADRWSAIASGALWLLVPTNVAQTVTTYVDSAYASSVASALALAVAAVHLVHVARSRIPWSLGCALGGAIGLASAMKSTGAAFGVLTMGWLVLLLSVRLGGDRESVRFRARAAFLLVVAVVATAVGGYWYLRNWAIADDPLFPVAVRIGGRTLFPGEELSSVVDESQVPDQLRADSDGGRVLRAWAQQGLWSASSSGDSWQETVYSNDSRIGGLGYAWLLGGVPSLVAVAAIAWRRRDRAMGVALTTIVPIVVALFCVQPFHWWARFTLWLHALGLPCLASMATSVATANRGAARAIGTGWLALVTAVAAAEGMTATFVTVVGPVGASRSEIVDALTERYRDEPIAYVEPLQPLQESVFPQILSGDDGVGVGYLSSVDATKELVMGELCQPIGERTVLPIDPQASEDDVSNLMSAGVKYAILDDALPVPKEVAARALHIDRPAGFVVVTLQAPDE